ncbi:MAG: iron ABC transporter permease [Candidatus Wallbacteria bacterium]|nr:iron ABC transporter permease [Candidatus Wallbacteria bacterium]
MAALLVAAALLVPSLWLAAQAPLGLPGAADWQRHLRLLGNTLGAAAAAAVSAIVVGIPGGLLIGLARFPGKQALSMASLGLLAIPSHLHAIAWVAVLGPDGWMPAGQHLLYSAPGAGVVVGLALAPLAMHVIARGCRDADRSQVEAALLVRGRLIALQRVIVPAIAPWIGVAAVFVFALAAGNYGVPEHLRVHVHTVEAMAQFSALADGPGAAVMALPLAALCAVLGATALGWLLTQGQPTGGGEAVLLKGAWNGLAGTCALGGLLGISGALPLLGLAVRAGGLAAFLDAARQLGPDLPGSFELAALAGLGAGAGGVTLALAGRFGLGRWTGPIVFAACLLAFALPEAILAVAAVSWLSTSFAAPALYGTSAGLGLVLALRYAPLGWALTAASLAGVSRAEEDAGRLAGATLPRFIWRIVLPRIAAAVGGTALLAGALSLSDLEASLVMTPPGVNPVGVRLFNMIHYGLDSLLAASIFLIATLVGLTAAAGCWLVGRTRSWAI